MYRGIECIEEPLYTLNLNERGNKFQTVGPNTGKAHGPKVIVLASAMSIPDAPPSEKNMIVLTIQ